MLKVDNINLFYGAAQALRGVSIAAEPGKVMCVLGRNGVGKTSLLRALVGQYPIASGSISFDGTDITALKPYERARRGIGRQVSVGRVIVKSLCLVLAEADQHVVISECLQRAVLQMDAQAGEAEVSIKRH